MSNIEQRQEDAKDTLEAFREIMKLCRTEPKNKRTAIALAMAEDLFVMFDERLSILEENVDYLISQSNQK